MELLLLFIVVGIALYFMSSLRRAVQQSDVALNISLDKSEKKLVDMALDPKERAETHKKYQALLNTYK